MHNITPITGTGVVSRQQGALIKSVTNMKERQVHYGVQSATFVRTVFPNQATGTYRINSMLPTWQGPRINANSIVPGSVTSHSGTQKSSLPALYRAAGSPPNPYPPHNASAFYSKPHTRIIPNR